jgi:predicted DNA-binding transcriptional regulator AlpA
MLHADLSFFENLPDSALIREKLIIGQVHKSHGKMSAETPRIVPVSRSTWRRMVKAGQAPAPVKLHTGISAWRVGDLRGWLASRSDSLQQSNPK